MSVKFSNEDNNFLGNRMIKIIGFKKYLKQMWIQNDLKENVFQIKGILTYAGKDLNGVFEEDKYPSQPATDMEVAFSNEPCFDY